MKKNFANEFHKLLNNQCSPAELDEFLSKIDDDQYKEHYMRLISSVLSEDINNNEIDESVRLRLNNRLENILSDSQIEKSDKEYKTINRFYKYAAAAIVLLTLSAALFFYTGKYHNLTKVKTACTIHPGGNKAVLTLSDGSEILLTDVENGQLAIQQGISIVKTRDGQVIYNAVSEDYSDHPDLNLRYNTLETPRGGQYQINLPDGTKVWLNAESSLSFPPTFETLTEREVELSGEAYFEVAKDKIKPFKVTAVSGSGLKQEVKVLGTHFNINSYKDEKITKTTLLEGSVRITGQAALPSPITRILKPGQQSVLSSSGIDVKQVDVEEVVAWKNGFFIFENDNLEGILKKFARWYDVDIIYNGNLNHVKVTGSVSRSTELSDVLRILEKTDEFKFKLQGRRILVMP